MLQTVWPQHRRGFGAGEPHRAQPVDQLLPQRGAGGIAGALVGVVDDPQAVALAGERAIHTGGDAATPLAGEPVAHRRRIAGQQVAGHPVEVAGLPGVGVGQLRRVRRDRREEMRVALQEVGRKQLGDQQRFPQPRLTGDDQPAQLAIGHLLEQVDQHLGPAVEAVAGVGLGDEAAQALGFRWLGGGGRGQVQQAAVTPGVELAQQQAAYRQGPVR